MSHTELNKLQFIIALIAEFADYYQLNKKQAFNYLKRFKEIEFFERHYDVMHTQSFENM